MNSLLKILLLLAAAISGFAAELNVFAAASLSDALQELAPRFQQATGHTLRFNFAASGTLARQIQEGAPADLFFSADEARVDQLTKAGLIIADTRRVMLANRLVVVVPADADGAVTSPADLAKAGIRHIAIGEPATVPAGTYARSYLQKTGAWTALQPKLVPLDNVRAVLAAVASGNTEAGFVYHTDALLSKAVKIAFEIPADASQPIVYPLAVLRDSRQPGAARALAGFLAQTEAQAVFARHGFLPPSAR